MKFKRIAVSLTIILLLFLSFSADISSGKVTTVEKGGYSFARYDPGKGDEIRYEFEVLSGPKIDVFVMNQTNFNKYENLSEFEYYEDSSILGSGEGAKTFKSPTNDTLYIVMDGTVSGKVNPDSSSTVEMKSVRTPKSALQEGDRMNLPKNWWLYILIPVVVIILLFLWLSGQGDGGEEEEEESLRKR